MSPMPESEEKPEGVDEVVETVGRWLTVIDTDLREGDGLTHEKLAYFLRCFCVHWVRSQNNVKSAQKVVGMISQMSVEGIEIGARLLREDGIQLVLPSADHTRLRTTAPRRPGRGRRGTH